MSSLASSWLEKHFKIPGKISSLERDLANGYILLLVAEQCELLTPEQMEASKNSQIPSDIVENFKILNKGLEKWHIKLNKSEIANIVSEVRRILSIWIRMPKFLQIYDDHHVFFS